MKLRIILLIFLLILMLGCGGPTKVDINCETYCIDNELDFDKVDGHFCHCKISNVRLNRMMETNGGN